MYTYLIALAGAPGAGKSTLAKALGERKGWRVRSFGSYVREVAKERGLPEERTVLQTLGDTLGQELGEAEFTARTISEPRPGETGIILEGIRKHAQWEEARKHATYAFLVYLDVSDDIAKERLLRRGLASDDGKTYEAIVNHPMEIERATLKNMATIVLQPDTIEAWVNEIRTRIL